VGAICYRKLAGFEAQDEVEKGCVGGMDPALREIRRILPRRLRILAMTNLCL